MRVAVVHYHYRPGGVTRVVENAFESIQGRGITAVAIGGEPYHGGKMPVRLQPGLRYSQANEKLSPGPLWYALRMTARQALGGEPDVWHFHNPALGKNSAMAEVVGKMAAETPVLLQFHDFAEDGRPANYAMLRDRMENIGRLYPQASQVHYATTNARDRAYLCQSGFNPENVHLLANPVRVPEGAGTEGATGAGTGSATDFGRLPGLEALGSGQPLYLYPTRAIRRKNLGEFLLWAALSSDSGSDALFATTLEPENPAARQVYERWVAFARRLGLPVAFAVGQGRGAPDFSALMHRAQAVASTSVAEGFGLAFLEPWLFGKAVLGRNLPDITADFAAQGVALGNLYEQLLVPEDLLDMGGLRRRLAEGLERTYAAYRRNVPAGALEICLRAAGDGAGRIDFGRLDEIAQEEVISALVASPALCAQMAASARSASGGSDTGGSGVSGAGATGMSDSATAGVSGAWVLPSQAVIDANARAVREHFGTEQYGQRLAALYRKVADSQRAPLSYADPERLLDKFLTPERFSPLCS